MTLLSNKASTKIYFIIRIMTIILRVFLTITAFGVFAFSGFANGDDQRHIMGDGRPNEISLQELILWI